MNAPIRHAHSMLVMDRTGHTTVTWDTRDPASVNDARREFQRLIREGYSAFAMNIVSNDRGEVVVEEKGNRISEFNPEAGRVMMVPHLVGG